MSEKTNKVCSHCGHEIYDGAIFVIGDFLDNTATAFTDYRFYHPICFMLMIYGVRGDR
jgi:hypothetical protein